MMMKQLTKEQAIAFGENKLYEEMTLQQIAEFQLAQKRLCVPFDLYHEAVEKALGRPVFSHELGMNQEGLLKELYGEKKPPTLEEVMSLISEEKLVTVIVYELKRGE